ncbi:hypothetical protein WISP_34694 [Willisornis vidua]|uniref:Uncharacterized protein n=1 Tax=Willisornis vidua TaxID=1566151 RepID=A0ABQ9DIZ7_9PASS|nr:hypothetical protein WISP_34694 [Willisornis vidua]
MFWGNPISPYPEEQAPVAPGSPALTWLQDFFHLFQRLCTTTFDSKLLVIEFHWNFSLCPKEISINGSSSGYIKDNTEVFEPIRQLQAFRTINIIKLKKKILTAGRKKSQWTGRDRAMQCLSRAH